MCIHMYPPVCQRIRIRAHVLGSLNTERYSTCPPHVSVRTRVPASTWHTDVATAPPLLCMNSMQRTQNRLNPLKRGGVLLAVWALSKKRHLIFNLFLELKYCLFPAKVDAESFALVLQLSGFELIDILKTCVLRKQFSNLLKTEQTYSCNFRCDDVIGVKFHRFGKRVKVIQHRFWSDLAKLSHTQLFKTNFRHFSTCR